MCVMCSTSVPTLFQYFFYDHIPTFLYIFHEMFFITCVQYERQNKSVPQVASTIWSESAIGGVRYSKFHCSKKRFMKNVKECRDVNRQKSIRTMLGCYRNIAHTLWTS